MGRLEAFTIVPTLLYMETIRNPFGSREASPGNLFRGCYFDPTGKEYSCTRSEVSTNDELDVMEPVVYLDPNYAYDTVTLRLNRTLRHRLDTPLAVEIK